jgi:hypothetical protein
MSFCAQIIIVGQESIYKNHSTTSHFVNGLMNLILIHIFNIKTPKRENNKGDETTTNRYTAFVVVGMS